MTLTKETIMKILLSRRVHFLKPFNSSQVYVEILDTSTLTQATGKWSYKSSFRNDLFVQTRKIQIDSTVLQK